MEKTYTTKEAAEVLRVTPETVRSRIAQGDLKAVRTGKQYVILETDLRNYLKVRTHNCHSHKAAKGGYAHEFY